MGKSNSLFEGFAKLCKTLEYTSSRKDKAKLISTYLIGLSSPDAALAIQFLTGRVFPEQSRKKLEIGHSTLNRLARSIGFY